ncbi:MAG: BON domain-containing protein [bacterium]
MNKKYSKSLIAFVAVAAILGFMVLFQGVHAAEKPSDEVVTSWVREALGHDPHIVSTDIDVRTFKGIVTLSGSVTSLAEKRYAELEAKKIQGVLGVINEIVVAPDVRFDTDIAHDIRHRVINNAFIKAKGLDINVSDGHVTISGTVSSRAESKEIELLASEVRGAKSIINDLRIEFPSHRSDQDIEKDVISSMSRDVYLNGLSISVGVKDGVVTLNGSVDNAYQKKIAGDVALWVGNVKGIENNLAVKWQDEEAVKEGPPSISDDQLTETLRLEFNEDTRLAPLNITIEASAGHITLRGSVPSYFQKRVAGEDARDVIGVSGVTNLLTVKAAGRDDDAIRDDLQFEYKSDYALNIYAIDVSVKDGFVTLSGIVNSIYDKKRAGIIASRVLGVKDVVNNIAVSSGSAFNYKHAEVGS